jgi:hypothetical protein
MTKARVLTTDAEIDAALARAIPDELLAVSIKYVAEFDIFIIGLTDGNRLVLQRERLQELQNATKSQLANVEVLALGTDLHWKDLDVDLYVPALIAGVYGTTRWMSEIGRAGGSAKSKAKSLAAKANGRKGGRPRKELKQAATAR